MGAISVKLPESIHKQVEALAMQEGTSIDQFIATALAEKMAALLTETYLQQRSANGSREKFEQALNKVSSQEPPAFDAL